MLEPSTYFYIIVIHWTFSFSFSFGFQTSCSRALQHESSFFRSCLVRLVHLPLYGSDYFLSFAYSHTFTFGVESGFWFFTLGCNQSRLPAEHYRISTATARHVFCLLICRSTVPSLHTIHFCHFVHTKAIHARSIFPCQDTPFVKSTYSATVCM